MRRTCTIGILALVLAIGAIRTPVAHRFIGSAQSFGRRFHSLESAQSISPIERLVLSFAMTS